ncbi:MAG: acetyltransferase [Halobacteriota archaeon]|nr:acetyltransferase [Halobacteriota archaeon]
MKALIYGACPLGRSIMRTLEDEGKYEIVGIIDDFKEKGLKYHNLVVLGDFSSLTQLKEEGVDSIFSGIGYSNMRLRGELFNRIKKMGFKTPNVIHSSAIIDKSAILGSGIDIFAGAIVDNDAKISDNVLIHIGSTVAHDVIIHNNVFVSANATIAGFVEIHEESFIGAGSSIKDQIKIGRNVIVGLGAVVIKDVPDNTVVAGVPARIIRENFEKIQPIAIQ